MLDTNAATKRVKEATYAVVLAGGRGSRLGQLTDHRAKPAVPFGGKFRLIDFVLSNCPNSESGGSASQLDTNPKA